jgi:hypothetical protein
MKPLRIVVAILLLVLIAAFVLYSTPLRQRFGPRISGSRFFTCSLCGSTKQVDRKYILGYIPRQVAETIKYKSPGFDTCNHVWSPGISVSPDKPVPNNVVVLVHESGQYGAFILRQQSISPERAEYDWWYRTDGGSLFDTNDSIVMSGHGSTPKIHFGTFNLSWSGHDNKSGWLMYKHAAGDVVAPQDLHLCITERDSVQGLDAALPDWKYKATPVD